MPDNPQTPETPAPVPAVPTPDPVEAERAARLVAEQRAAWAEGAATATQEALRFASVRQPDAPHQEDWVGKVVGADITITPEERKQALEGILANQAAQIEARNRQELDRRMAAERQAMTFDMAINSVVGRRPELNDPKNSPDFRAAMTKAKAEADQRGEQVTPLQLLQRAEQVYDTVFKPRSAPPVPFVEGGARPDLNAPMSAPTEPPGPSRLEKMYGMEAGKIGEIPDMVSPEMDAEIDAYIKQRNQPLMKRGINTGIKSIRFYKD